MTNPLYTIATFPADDQEALREFNDRYLAALAAAPPPAWSDLGELFPTTTPMVTFPISNLALKFQQTQGKSHFRTLQSKAFDVKTEEFDAGIEGNYLDILSQVFAYRQWQQGPARLMTAEARHRNKSIAALLAGGHTGTKWGVTAKQPTGIDDAYFFSATHLSDFNDAGSATWSNYQSSGTDCLDFTALETEITTMQAVPDENGDVLGVDPDTILVPTGKYERMRNKLAKDLLLESNAGGTYGASTNNPFKGRFNLLHVPELTTHDANDFYLVDSKMMAAAGIVPWISMRYTTPDPALALRTWDAKTDFFKDTGRIKVSSHIWYGFALGFPHCIRKVVGA